MLVLLQQTLFDLSLTQLEAGDQDNRDRQQLAICLPQETLASILAVSRVRCPAA